LVLIRENQKLKIMKIVVIGGTGLIGTKVVAKLRARGHQVIAASPNTGINTFTGEGLAEALRNTEVVIDLANSPSWEDKAVLEFFQTAGHNLLAAETNAGVKHHIALSIVGVLDMLDSGYMRGKKAQEDVITQSGVPYTIIRSTQFFEFIKGIADQATVEDTVHASDVQFQPIAAEDVAGFVTDTALAAPINGVTEIAGPERLPLPTMIDRYLQATGDPRKVQANGDDRYYGAKIGSTSLVPSGKARLGTINLEKWLAGQTQKA
jgi:uncharacterized protein YbjT (DUF2867 family)